MLMNIETAQTEVLQVKLLQDAAPLTEKGHSYHSHNKLNKVPPKYANTSRFELVSGHLRM